MCALSSPSPSLSIELWHCLSLKHLVWKQAKWEYFVESREFSLVSFVADFSQKWTNCSKKVTCSIHSKLPPYLSQDSQARLGLQLWLFQFHHPYPAILIQVFLIVAITQSKWVHLEKNQKETFNQSVELKKHTDCFWMPSLWQIHFYLLRYIRNTET